MIISLDLFDHFRGSRNVDFVQFVYPGTCPFYPLENVLSDTVNIRTLLIKPGNTFFKSLNFGTRMNTDYQDNKSYQKPHICENL